MVDLLFDQLGEEGVGVRSCFLIVGDGQGVDPGVDNVGHILHLAAVEVKDLGDTGASVLGCESIVVAAGVGALSDLEQDGQAAGGELRPRFTTLLSSDTGAVAGGLPVGGSIIAHAVDEWLDNV